MQYTVTMKNIKHDFPYILGTTGKKKNKIKTIYKSSNRHIDVFL